jgi:DNA-binding transcriptional LysR family regulator
VELGANHDELLRPEDLLDHECLAFRSQTTGALYAWELERGRRNWRVPVRGSVVTNDHMVAVALAAEGLGLAYAFEPAVVDRLRSKRLVRVLEAYAPSVPGYFLLLPVTSCTSRAEPRAPRRCDCSWRRHASGPCGS